MGDLFQWLSLTEHDVLLHNGLLRATGLIPVPSGITYQSEEDRELPSFDGKTPDELASILDGQCSEQAASFANLMEYRLNALKGLWKARGQLTGLETSNKEQQSPSVSQGGVQDDNNSSPQSFASVVGLILVFPILRSLSKTDPSLSSDVAKTLLQQLRSYPPFSLSKEPLECITGVEQLLVSWLHSAATQDDKQLQNAASALVALAVAQGSPPLILRTVHELQSFQSRDLHLLVPSVLSTLLESHIASLTPSPLVATHHRTCWEYDHPSTNHQELDQKQSTVPSITSDGRFLYILYPSSGNLVKLGTGEGGTLRGFCYTQSTTQFEPGFIAWAGGALFYRKHSVDVVADNKQSSGQQQQQQSKLLPFCHRIDHNTLQITGDISCDSIVTSDQMKMRNTIHFTSDGTHIYWLYAVAPPPAAAADKDKEKNKQEQVYLETLIVKDGQLSVSGHPVVLQSLQGSSQQAMEQNETIRFILRAHTHGISPSVLSSLLTHQSSSSSNSEGNNVTSCGLPLPILKSSVIYCCGTFLVMVVPATVAKKSKSLLAPVSSAGKKALCQCFCYRLTDGSCVEQTELNPTPELQCALTKDGTLDNMSACYDATNHAVWTLASSWIDLWECPGSLALHQVAKMLGKTSVDELLYGCTTGDTLPITNTIDTLVKHLGMQGCQKDKSCPDSMYLKQCISILRKGVIAQQWDVVHCMAALLQALLSQLKDGIGDELIAELQSVAWNLVNYSKSPSTLQPLLHKIISEHFVVLYPTRQQQNRILYQLCQSSLPNVVLLRGEVFARVGLDHALMQQLYGKLDDVGGIFTLTRACGEESVVTLRRCHDLSDEEFQHMVKSMPVFTPLMQFTASAVFSYMHCSCVSRTNTDDTEESWKQLSKFLDGMLGVCKECLDVLVEVCRDISEERRTKGGLERVVQTTLLGAVLPAILTVLSDKELKLYCIADSHLSQLHQLAQQTSEAAQLLHPDNQSYRVPLPWATGCTLETVHPVKDGYKYKDTVVFPGARNLFLKFDPRCASQYDYDKVIIYAGDSLKASKVAEYGGNTYGYGSRSVLGGGWPSQSVKVEGDTVTVMFEMKSGREHNTPDKAVWGFACTVRPQEVSTDDGCSSLPFIIDLSLAITSLSCSLISQLYDGPAVSSAEQECQTLMTSPLLQRCVWESTWAGEKVVHLGHVKVDVNKVVPYTISHDPLAAHMIQKLRDIAGKPQPAFRKRVKDLIKPDKLEDLMITVSLKHLGIPPALEIVGIYTSTQEISAQIMDVLQAIFLRIDALLRRLQSLVELELTWAQEVLEIAQGTMELRDASFLSLVQQESSIKQFEFLCCLKDIELSQCDPYQASKKLQELMERDVEKAKSRMTEKGSSTSAINDDDTTLNDQLVVKSYVDAIIDRTQLLLYVTMATDDPTTPLTSDYKEPVILSPTTSPSLLRSFSAPPPSLTKSGSFTEYTRHSRSTAVAHHSVLDISSCSPTTSLLDQIFQFIGDQPETAISLDTFLVAARHQWVRGWCRHRALEHMQELLELQAEQGVGLVEVVTKLGIILKKGLRISEVSCSGCMTKLRDAITQTMKCLVDLASQQPYNCINTISIISIIPYSKDDEACIVYSGLVKLLDKLCSKEDVETQPIELEKPIEEAIEEEKQSDIVGQLAWGAFRVLAARCVSWETKQDGSDRDEVLSSGLAQQVSSLLTNHLSRAIQKMTSSESGTAEALQDALSLLLGLSKSKLGCAILSQPVCVSRLLGLLVDHRPSPKLILIVLQLCRMALPLMTAADCILMEVPAHPSIDLTHANTPTAVTQLLLAKLAEYIVPDVSHTPSSSSQVLEVGGAGTVNGDSGRATTMDTSDTQDGRLSVYLHKRNDQSPQDVLQPLLCHDPRQFRTGAMSGHVDHWMRMDRQLAEHNKAEIVTDEKRVAIRKAIRWAQLGFTISLRTPVEGTSAAVADQKKAKQEAECKKRNLELMRTDPPRPFLSGHVANSLASEIIGLLHSLLTEPGSAAVWAAAVRQVLGQALSSVPQLIPKLSKHVEEIHGALMTNTAPVAPVSCLHQASLATAAFATLGGFHESLRPGLRVEVTGGGVINSCGTIISILDRRGLATVQFDDDSACYDPRQSLEVPLSRLCIPQRGSVSLNQLNLQKELAVAVCTAVDAPTPSLGLVPATADASTCAMGMCRLVAELRSRACMALSYHIGDKQFCHSLLTTSIPSGQSCMPLLSTQAEECCPGERLSVVSSHCESLRMLYRDCSRPAPPHHAPQVIKPKHFMLDPHSSWPKISSCLFADNMTNVTYFGAAPQPSSSSSSSSSSNPASSPAPSSNQVQLKGVVIYANMSLPSGAPSFYWEIELCSLGDSGGQEEGRHVGMGLSSKPSIPEGGSPPASFVFMKDTCLVRSSGKAVQYTGESILDRKSFRVSENSLKATNVLGCGWVCYGEELTESQQAGKGYVYFTVNGQKAAEQFDNVPTSMTPFIHLPKKGIRVNVNFGERPFLYAEGREHRDAADGLSPDSQKEMAAIFSELPFHSDSDDEQEQVERQATATPLSDEPLPQLEPIPIPGPSVRRPKSPIATVGYHHSTSVQYLLGPSMDTMLESSAKNLVLVEEESSSAQAKDQAQQDPHALLVKAWEAEVFPVIRRRFRNDAERKSGLEQIRGALQLGMEDIALQTVEFLYEENGGLPRDLVFPTLEDVKRDADKLTVDHCKKGLAVVIASDININRCGVRPMSKTLGLIGNVLLVDKPHDLVQVECYLSSEGALVHYWYHVSSLQRPPPGYRRSPAMKGAEVASSPHVHRELLACEASLVHMYCRQAVLELSSSQDIPLEPLPIEPHLHHLHMLCCAHFAEPLPDCLTVSENVNLACDPRHALLAVQGSLLDNFFQSTENFLKQLERVLESFSKAGQLVVLTEKLLQCLHNSPKQCGHLEIKLGETKENSDIHFPSAAFLYVSCLATEPPVVSKQTWVQIFCYKGGQGKAGRQQLQEVIQYPSEVPSHFPTVLLPFDHVHVKILGCSASANTTLVFHALPPNLLLALAFSTVLLQVRQTSEQLTQCLQVCFNRWEHFLKRYDAPSPLKLTVFQLLSQLSCTGPSIRTSADFVTNLQSELKQLYEKEVTFFQSSSSSNKGKTKALLSFPPKDYLTCGGTGRFSNYLQSLLELYLTINRDRGVEKTEVEPKKKSSKAKKSASAVAAAKEETKDWLNKLSHIVESLLPLEERSFSISSSSYFDQALTASLPVKIHNRLLVVTGLPTVVPCDEVRNHIQKLTISHGGLYRNELYVASEKRIVPTTPDDDVESLSRLLAGEKDKQEEAPAADGDVKADEKGPNDARNNDTKGSTQDNKPGDKQVDIPLGHAILEVSSSVRLNQIKSAILSSSLLKIEGGTLAVHTVSDQLQCSSNSHNNILHSYLKSKLCSSQHCLHPHVKELFTKVFNSSIKESSTDDKQQSVAGASKASICDNNPCNLLKRFLNGYRGKTILADILNELYGDHTAQDGGLLPVQKFLDWVSRQCWDNVIQVWSGLLAIGYNLHFERVGFIAGEFSSPNFSAAQDQALVHHVDSLCRRLSCSPALLQTTDIVMDETHFVSKQLQPLQGVDLLDIRMRFLCLQYLNQHLLYLLPVVNLLITHSTSLATRLCNLSSLMFYDHKITFLHHVINASARRAVDQAPPEIKLDPLEVIGDNSTVKLSDSQFCQAVQQLAVIPSQQLCVRLASGGDPTYAFNVKMAGEEVHGTSGSFRQFLWQIVKELQSPLLPILMACPSSAMGINKGKYILVPGSLTFPDEKLLQFFGQLLGVIIRADIPVGLDIMPYFWRALLGKELTLNDLREADIVTYTLTEKILQASTTEEFHEVIGAESFTFTLTTLDGRVQELCKDGANTTVNWDNRADYVKMLREKRIEELASKERISAIKCGLATIIPLEVLSVFSEEDLDLRVCGIPEVDLDYLKIHTMYQVGLMETDKHVQFFWEALASFSQEELRKFIKFACNQERIPHTCPCREGGSDITHVPPYPMKIAPPDGSGTADSRYIRAETCLFMVKLPQYSSVEIMNEKLRYAINCREDPLSG